MKTPSKNLPFGYEMIGLDQHIYDLNLLTNDELIERIYLHRALLASNSGSGFVSMQDTFDEFAKCSKEEIIGAEIRLYTDVVRLLVDTGYLYYKPSEGFFVASESHLKDEDLARKDLHQWEVLPYDFSSSFDYGDPEAEEFASLLLVNRNMVPLK